MRQVDIAIRLFDHFGDIVAGMADISGVLVATHLDNLLGLAILAIVAIHVLRWVLGWIKAGHRLHLRRRAQRAQRRLPKVDMSGPRPPDMFRSRGGSGL